MGSALKPCLKKNISVLLLAIFSLFGCQSRLDVVGQDHALVVKKWQELAKYTDKSTTNNPFIIVGKLAVDRQSEVHKFVLTDIHLTQEENHFELNLIRPSFDNKYICMPVCLQLTEYFSNNQDNTTMLYRYFEQQEFELFKFYGDVVLQNDSINELLEFYPVAATQYINWLIRKEQKFQDLVSLTAFLRGALTKENIILFLNTPDDFYMDLLTNSQNMLNKSNVWNLNDATAETDNWTNTATVDEAFLTLNRLGQELRMQNWLEIQDNALAIGDQVCSFEKNEFGIVSEIIGNKVQVRLVGKLIKLVDGSQVSTRPGDIYNREIQHSFTSISRDEVYQASTIALCEINQRKIEF
jgi:hypothetical protein